MNNLKSEIKWLKVVTQEEYLKMIENMLLSKFRFTQSMEHDLVKWKSPTEGPFSPNSYETTSSMLKEEQM